MNIYMTDLVVIGAGHALLDTGDTLIGMHLRPVAVPYRGEIRQIGRANLVCAYSACPMQAERGMSTYERS